MPRASMHFQGVRREVIRGLDPGGGFEEVWNVVGLDLARVGSGTVKDRAAGPIDGANP